MTNKKFISNEENVCPVCGNEELNYGIVQIADSTGGYFPWECPNCEATGKEWFSIEFVEHYEVYDVDDNEVIDTSDYKEGDDNDEM